MMNTLLGVGIGYLIFRWADSDLSKGAQPEPKSPEDADPTPTRPAGVWTLREVSNDKQDLNSGLFYACGTYAWDEGRTGTYRYIVVQSVEPDAPLSMWSDLMGADGSIAYTFASKADCVEMVNQLTAPPTPDSPVAPESPPEEPPQPPSNPTPLPDFGMGYRGNVRGSVY